MEYSTLKFIREASANELTSIALALAAHDHILFCRLAADCGISAGGDYTFDFPHGRDTISSQTFLEIKQGAWDGGKVRAIKTLRDAMGWSLYDSKRAVEHLQEIGRIEFRYNGQPYS